MAINITAKGDPEKKLKWAFKMYDVDGNGEIDKNEMLQIIQSIYDLIGLNDEKDSGEVKLKVYKDKSNDEGEEGEGKEIVNKSHGEDEENVESPLIRTEQVS